MKFYRDYFRSRASEAISLASSLSVGGKMAPGSPVELLTSEFVRFHVQFAIRFSPSSCAIAHDEIHSFADIELQVCLIAILTALGGDDDDKLTEKDFAESTHECVWKEVAAELQASGDRMAWLRNSVIPTVNTVLDSLKANGFEIPYRNDKMPGGGGN